MIFENGYGFEFSTLKNSKVVAIDIRKNVVKHICFPCNNDPENWDLLPEVTEILKTKYIKYLPEGKDFMYAEDGNDETDPNRVFKVIYS